MIIKSWDQYCKTFLPQFLVSRYGNPLSQVFMVLYECVPNGISAYLQILPMCKIPTNPYYNYSKIHYWFGASVKYKFSIE